MTCSSSTISITDLARKILALTLAAAVGLAPMAGLAEPSAAGALIVAARQALARGDGVDAEVKLRTAIQRGARRDAVAADLGEAYLLQGDQDRAHQWLAPAHFSADTAVQGYRRLAHLLDMDGHPGEAKLAFDRALALAPNDAGLWVEIGRFRYRSGEHLDAIAASERALQLDPRNVRALEFKGELVRDRYGLLASVPWFQKALLQDSADIPVLLQYGATLGEAGQQMRMLNVTRRVLELSPGNARAYYLQAILAARAGNYELARALLARTAGRLDGEPATMLLRGSVELAAGNTDTASNVLEQFLALRPESQVARNLLGRALYLGGRYRTLTTRFADVVARQEASPYLLTLVARAYEQIGDREQAGVLLDRAAMQQKGTLQVLPYRTRVGALLGQGQGRVAVLLAEQARSANPGNYDAQSLAGDAQLAAGNAVAAQERYARAAEIRMSDNLLHRRFQAFAASGDYAKAEDMVRAWLAQNPIDSVALRLTAMLALRSGDQNRAAAIMEYLRATRGSRDVQLLSDLALLRAWSPVGVDLAETAYGLQRTSPVAAQALGFNYAVQGTHRAQATSLLDKAQRMLGDNPVLAQARTRLGEN